MSDADTVSLSFARFEGMRNELLTLRQEVEAARLEVRQAKLLDLPEALALQLGGERISVMADTIRHMLPIVAFAVANLHPLTVRGWPYQDLAALAALVLTIPALAPPELHATWVVFAERCERWEKGRELGIEQEMLLEDNAQRGISAEVAVRYGIAVHDAPGPLLTTPTTTTALPLAAMPEATTDASPG